MGGRGAVSLLEINMLYKDYLQSDTWKEFRAKIYKRRKNECRICKSTENLNLHHRYYRDRAGRDVLKYPRGQDVIILCQTCHYSWHKENGFKKLRPHTDIARLSRLHQLRTQQLIS